MKARFITALNSISITGKYGRGLRLSGIHFLTNDPAVIRERLTDVLRVAVGTLEFKQLYNADTVIYSIEDWSPSSDDNIEAGLSERLFSHLAFIQEFLSCLWLVKDNSANCELGFIEYPLKSLTARITSNFMAYRFSDSNGEFENRSFKRNEIDYARTFLKLSLTLDLKDFRYLRPSPTIPSESNRLDRAWYFLKAARSESDLGIKISHYITCFESLFTTDPAELSHKLSERLAYFLGDQVEERTLIYTNLKAAYNIRSKIVHGDRLKDSVREKLPEISSSCDMYLRQSLIKIFESPDLVNIFIASNQIFDKYFLNLTLGAELNN